ncbi:MAG: asparagine synthase-related protein [Candidatus Entotheonellia bacterium]
MNAFDLCGVSLPIHQTPLLTLVWLRGDHKSDDARTIAENLLRQARGPYGLIASVAGDARLAWGMRLPEQPAPLTCWSTYVDQAGVAMVEGDLYDDPAGLRLLPGHNPQLARRVAAHMRRCPDRPLTELNGIYSGVYVDRSHACAYIFGDQTGTRPVFWLANAAYLVVTGNLWAFRGCDGFERRWDPMALTQMLTVGFPMAGRTWLAGVRQLQRGRQVRAFADGRTDVRMLLEPIPRQSCSLQQSVRLLRESMDCTVTRMHRRLDAPVGLGLSGGLDSRILLASLHTQKLEHRNFTFCFDPQDAENQVAQAATRLLGEPHRTVTLDPVVPRSLHRDIRLINEGVSPGFGYWLLAAAAQQDVQTLLLGYESMRLDPPGGFNPLAVACRPALARYMLAGYMTQFTPSQAASILAPGYRVSWQDVLDEWVDSFDQIQQPTMADVCLEHMTDYSHQRRIRPLIEPTRWFCLPAYPYLDQQLYTAYYRLPLAHLQADQAHLALLCDYRTGLEKLPSSAWRFPRLPISQQYRYRSLIQLGRIVRYRWVRPLQRAWEASQLPWGGRRSALNALRTTELERLQHYELFHWPEVQRILERARQGTFTNRNALNRLINVAVIDDVLFGSALSIVRPLPLLDVPRDLRFIQPATTVPSV